MSLSTGIVNISLLSEYLSMGVTEIGCMSHPEISEYSLKKGVSKMPPVSHCAPIEYLTHVAKPTSYA